MRTGLSADCAAAMSAANPYRQAGTRQWFEAGWFAWGLRVKLGDGVTMPGIGRNGVIAYTRGLKARANYELAHDGQEEL